MKHDYHGKPASLSARLMRVARRYKREDSPEKAAELAALPKREDIDFPFEEHLIVELYSK